MTISVAPSIGTSEPYFNEEDLKLANTASLTSLSITIVVQRTTGLGFSGQYNTVGRSITQSSTSTASTITYQFNLAAGGDARPGRGMDVRRPDQRLGDGAPHGRRHVHRHLHDRRHDLHPDRALLTVHRRSRPRPEPRARPLEISSGARRRRAGPWH